MIVLLIAVSTVVVCTAGPSRPSETNASVQNRAGFYQGNLIIEVRSEAETDSVDPTPTRLPPGSGTPGTETPETGDAGVIILFAAAAAALAGAIILHKKFSRGHDTTYNI